MAMRKPLLTFYCWTLFSLTTILLIVAGCRPGALEVEEKSILSGNEKIVVMGFRPALGERDMPKTVRDPLSGVVFSAEPVSPRVAEKMNQDLFDRLVSRGGHELITPGQALGAYSSIANREMDLALLPAKMLQEVGKAMDADLVLAGYIYRWRERKGTDYGVEQAASVAFDLHLVRTLDGAVVWKAKFDKTQRSLTENLLDLWAFIKGGGRWMTADKLAGLGLKQMLDKMD